MPFLDATRICRHPPSYFGQFVGAYWHHTGEMEQVTEFGVEPEQLIVAVQYLPLMKPLKLAEQLLLHHDQNSPVGQFASKVMLHEPDRGPPALLVTVTVRFEPSVHSPACVGSLEAIARDALTTLAMFLIMMPFQVMMRAY